MNPSLLYLFVYKLKELIIALNAMEDHAHVINASYRNPEYERNRSVSTSPESGSSQNEIDAYEMSSSQSLLSQITALTLKNIEFDDTQLNLIVVITRHGILR